MHAMLGTHEPDPQMPVSFERLGWKIPTALGACAVRLILPASLHIPHPRSDLSAQVYAEKQQFGFP